MIEKNWRRGGDSRRIPCPVLRNLQKTRCRSCRECRICRGSLPDIARWLDPARLSPEILPKFVLGAFCYPAARVGADMAPKLMVRENSQGNGLSKIGIAPALSAYGPDASCPIVPVCAHVQ